VFASVLKSSVNVLGKEETPCCALIVAYINANNARMKNLKFLFEKEINALVFTMIIEFDFGYAKHPYQFDGYIMAKRANHEIHALHCLFKANNGLG
jgi:hypothetical protein